MFTGKSLKTFSPTKHRSSIDGHDSSDSPDPTSASSLTASSTSEPAAADQLSARVAKMLHTIEKELDEVDASIGSKVSVQDRVLFGQ